MKKFLTLIAGAALITACSNEADVERGYVPSTDKIVFAVAADDMTRAKGEITSTADMGLVQDGTTKVDFGVFGCYTGALKYENTTVKPDFMYNQCVTFGDNGWDYAPTKYWPNEEEDYVSFFAYAPYEPNPGVGQAAIIDMSRPTDYGDPWINFRLPDYPWGNGLPINDYAYVAPNQVDLLYGVKTIGGEGHSDELFTDQKRPKLSDSEQSQKMKFNFRHALACFGDKITIKMSQALATRLQGYADVTITKITISYENLAAKARLVLNSPSGPNWKEIISGELTTTRTYERALNDVSFLMNATDNTTAKTISEGDGLFYIPFRISGTEEPQAVITIDYTVKNNANSIYTGTATNTCPLSLITEGKKQALELTLGEDFDLQHLVYDLTNETATGPSYSREAK